MGESNVKLLGSCLSPFASRVRIALRLKSVDHDFIEENLLQPKSKLLLKSNPVYKKIPVLIHDDNPICESLIILQYIDEVWPTAPSILPYDADERAESRFWAFYIDDKLVPTLIAVLIAESEDAKKAA
ncbi:Glutathione S-transferase U16 [Hibiscus syriacus]|uniref:Glutathione S-transferase n=1 Tax=Hibiscus syriacus TaxID=106335 RepID=A0A6A2XUI8_HIBSY|nr:Glutathione S-transferase U16 [Hibiscus syriacus]